MLINVYAYQRYLLRTRVGNAKDIRPDTQVRAADGRWGRAIDHVYDEQGEIVRVDGPEYPTIWADTVRMMSSLVDRQAR